ncbi:MAG: NAD(P)/FAD-dependent oxidoreductase [Porticoccaceae bacterium]
MTTCKSIAIIGAGIAGLSCAKILQDAGHNIHIFEKSRGCGGRMSTRRGEQWQCDHGAQYFTARNPLFRAEVSRWQQAGAVALWQPKIRIYDNHSFREHTSSVDRFVGTPRMTAPARLLAENLDVQFQITINRLERQKHRWKLHSVEHGALDQHFDTVVLAVPAPQATPLLQPFSHHFKILPTDATMVGCWAMMLQFSKPTEMPFDAAFVNGGPLRWIARDSSKPGRGATETWLLHASGDWSEAHIEESPDTVAAVLLQAFQALGGADPQTWAAHRWRYAHTEKPLHAGYLWEDNLALGLCGDWLNGDKVEGAWLSGLTLANAIAHATSS